MKRIDESLRNVSDKTFHGNGWGKRHVEAWSHPTAEHERAVRDLVAGWARYADSHCERIGSPVTECGVLGRAWVNLGRQLLVLLNGELGRFDAGTLDGLIRAIATDHGASSEL